MVKKSRVKNMDVVEALKKAIQEKDLVLLNEATHQLRFELGYDYDKTFKLAHRLTGISLEEFNLLVEQCDHLATGNL